MADTIKTWIVDVYDPEEDNMLYSNEFPEKVDAYAIYEDMKKKHKKCFVGIRRNDVRFLTEDLLTYEQK